MNRVTVFFLAAMLLYGGTASAQLPLPGALNFEGGVVGHLLGDDGVVPGLLVTVQTLDFSHTINPTAGPTGSSGLVQGTAGAGANATLTSLLVTQDLNQTFAGLQIIVNGLLAGLQQGLFGDQILVLPGLLGGSLLGGGLPVLGGLFDSGLLGDGLLSIGGLLDGDFPIIDGLLGGDLPLIGDLLGGNLLGGDLLGSILAIVGALLGDGLLNGGIPIVGPLVNQVTLPGL